MLKITIQNDEFNYSVDYSYRDKIIDGELEEFFPRVKAVIEDCMHLLSNIYTKEEISDVLAHGLDAMEYSEKGWKAIKLLRGNNM